MANAATVPASAVITSDELETFFAAGTDAAQWLEMSDATIDMGDTMGRRRAVVSLMACGCSKRLETRGHVFTFADGSALIVTRGGIAVAS
ncbi:MAG: hypothetical protein ACTSX8_04895 [Alphaproteobacteria bacterium]